MANTPDTNTAAPDAGAGISALLPAARILWQIDYANKKRVFERISKETEESSGVGRDIIFTELMERERLGPTTFGGHIAVPHVRIKEIAQPLCFLVRLKEGIVYTIGEEKVHTMFFLITPRSDEEKTSAAEQKNHLRLLAVISAMIENTALMGELAQCDDGARVLQKIIQWEKKNHGALRSLLAADDDGDATADDSADATDANSESKT